MNKSLNSKTCFWESIKEEKFLTRVKDFSKACYTGLAYVDAKNFDFEKSVIEKNGKKWVFYNRQKSHIPATVPFFKEAEHILKKYNMRLPIISNQKYNFYLKSIGEIVGLKKILTTHIGRKTAGSLWLDSGFTMEVVSKMLGHSSITTTQRYYAQVQTTRITRECDNLGIFF